MIPQAQSVWTGAQWVAATVIIAAVIVAQALKSKGSAPVRFPYRLRDSLLTPAELQFYRALRQATDVAICTKVRIADILQTPRGELAALRRISQKHVDFLLCDPETMRPLLAIELDDRSHERSERRARDEFVDKAYAAARLPILHVKTRQTYWPDELARQIAKLTG